MSEAVFSALGGIGLFLFGMSLMTEGLRALAGPAVRNALTRFTKTPVSGAATGAITTALIQSSSATTVTAVGFVSAGLMTFKQSLGIIFGANIGTTITGWMVAIIGFKLELGATLLPLVLVAAFMRIMLRGAARNAALAIAGFAIVFLGIDFLQAGMASFSDVVTPDRFPPDTFVGRIALVFIGVAITLVTQSSSAGVAAALAALAAGAISLPQGLAMVIGMDVGTTITAAIATIGASTAARRTGYSHVIYNLMTGALAFALLSPFAWFVSYVGDFDPQFALVAFHTAFNALGVIVILGFTSAFADFVIRMVPASGPALTRTLDEKLLADPHAALDATDGALQRIYAAVLAHMKSALSPGSAHNPHTNSIEEAIDATTLFMERIELAPDDASAHMRFSNALHALDHLRRLERRLDQKERLAVILKEDEFELLLEALKEAISVAIASAPIYRDGVTVFERLNTENALADAAMRDSAIRETARGAIEPDEAMERLDAARWLSRISYHLWRINAHLTG